MLKIVNHFGTNRGPQGKYLKFPIATHPKALYKHHLVVRVDTEADVNCMNEKTFNKLFPEVELSVCPHEIQNFRNSVADISILEQFCTYLQFRGEKYLNTFIVTNTNDCPNLLSYGATFRMGVQLPNYPEENVVRGENVPNFKVNTSEGTSSNVFQILQDLQLKQYQDQCHLNTMPSNSKTFQTTNKTQMEQNMTQAVASFRTITPSTAMTGTMTTKQVYPVHLTAPLSALTHQATDYKPGKVHFENFNQLKVEISNMKALPYFDVNAETTLQMDASKQGLGACLIQKGKVTCYASRTLTKTE